MKPYYQDEWVTIYHGDCLELLPNIGPADVIITDPVWPNAHPELRGSDDPLEIFTRASHFFPAITERLIVILGCDSDPRFLSAVPGQYKFNRVTWMRRIPPGYKGTKLINADIAYVFGDKFKNDTGKRVISGECLNGVSSGGREWWSKHPAYRNPKHMNYLIGWYSSSRDLILDPFAGVGGTIIAARVAGRKSIGIEIEEKYCEIIANRCSQSVMGLDCNKGIDER